MLLSEIHGQHLNHGLLLTLHMTSHILNMHSLSGSTSMMHCVAVLACASCDTHVVDKDTFSGFANMMHSVAVKVLNIGLRLIFFYHNRQHGL